MQKESLKNIKYPKRYKQFKTETKNKKQMKIDKQTHLSNSSNTLQAEKVIVQAGGVEPNPKLGVDCRWVWP